MDSKSSINQVINDFTSFSQCQLTKIMVCRAKSSRLRLEMCKMLLEASSLVDPSLMTEVSAAQTLGEYGDSLLLRTSIQWEESIKLSLHQKKTEDYSQIMREIGLLPLK